MDLNELDETLKLLNGFDKDIEKRKKLLNLIKENNRISIFAYGSLLWNPISHYNEFIPNCILNNYKKGFFCEDFIYRGNCSFTGLTMGLIKDLNSYVNGGLFISYSNQIIQFLKSFVLRESPLNYNHLLMNIYQYDLVEIVLPDGITIEYSITCIVNQKSLFYLNKQLTLDQQAEKIGQAHGKNGTNFQYLQKLKIIYEQLNINDSFSQHFQDLYDKIYLFRNGLSINFQRWFQIYDQLQLLEENNHKTTSSAITSFQPNQQITLLEQSTQIY